MNAQILGGGSENWTYAKLYIGQSLDRLDQLIVKVGATAPKISGVTKWFYIRYFDEQGVHLRLRVYSPDRDAAEIQSDLHKICASLINSLHELIPSTYYPMVVPPEYEDIIQEGGVAGGAKDVQIVYDDYVPEIEKFGGPAGMDIAEYVFRVSSEIACDILSDEAQGLYSRKDLIPALMNECFHAFLDSTKENIFWTEYSFYWLGGKTPGAEDWMEKFRDKGDELLEQGVDVVPNEGRLGVRQSEYVMRWRAALKVAVEKYNDNKRIIDFNREVLCFNFAHLMNNRLGIASLEEAYIAALLTIRAERHNDVTVA